MSPFGMPQCPLLECPRCLQTSRKSYTTMASATIPIVPSSIQSRFDIISGREKCSLRLIASDGSVRFGFGALRTEPLRQSFVYRAAWELGTYYRSWRLCRQSSILCGGLDPLDSIDGCQHELDCQDFGFFHGIVHLSAFDLRVLFGCATGFVCRLRRARMSRSVIDECP